MDGDAVSITSADIPRLLAAAERSTVRASLILDLVDGYGSGVDPSAAPARPRGGLRLSFTERGAGTPDARMIDPPWPLSTITNPSGYRLWFGARGDGGPPPDPGSYSLRIDSDLYAPYVTDVPVQVPTADRAIRCVLQPGYSYPFGGGGLAAPLTQPTLVRGVLQSLDGTGQAGAEIAVSAGAATVRYLTDSSGQFVVVVPEPAPDAVSVAITDAQGNKITLPDVAIAPGATTVIPQTVLTGRVESAVLGVIVQLAAPAVSVDAAPDGTWRIVLPLDQKAATVTVRASAPGQRKRAQAKVKVTPGQVVTVPPLVLTS
jgi:hypothetical protein